MKLSIRMIAALGAFGIGLATAIPTHAQSGETPLWQLGISTFGKKTDPSAGPPTQIAPPQIPGVSQANADASTDPTAGVTQAAGPATAPSMEIATTSGTWTHPEGATPNYESHAYESLPLPNTAMDLPIAPPQNVPPGALPPGALPLVDGPGVDSASLPIGSAIANGESAETVPLAEDTTAWYQIPWGWISTGWDNHAEFGLDGSSGNARTLALQTGLEMKRKTDRYTLALDFDYRKATNRGVTTEDNGRYNLDYDRMFDDSRWSAFGKFGAEWDQFKAFDLRLNLNGGMGYYFVRTDDATFVTRLGAGASQEIGAADDDWKPEAVFGTEAEYQLNRYNKLKGKLEYFPAWEDFSDYRLVADAAWEILLDDAENLSLKLAVTDRYDSTPQGAKPNDVYYSMLLLIKF
ncbi:DUF481 domain-containing protein [Roseiconus lacunae]|uniref:DUF481 domain-containing protein n=1 Tax=Roseiconus lacunae TaxID=2605694 RepID=A0ABT7PCT1_9BACT|nr:DUF481 domain-containing protein [Roseiconus lacunae]MDM4014305.1 DUF481 domain-containing protein [Roseiconus lacunae]